MLCFWLLWDAVILRIKAQRDGYSRYTGRDKNQRASSIPWVRPFPFWGPWLNMPVGSTTRRPARYAENSGTLLRIFTSNGRFSGPGKGRYLIMACGESGHPLSAHYRDCHEHGYQHPYAVSPGYCYSQDSATAEGWRPDRSLKGALRNADFSRKASTTLIHSVARSADLAKFVS